MIDIDLSTDIGKIRFVIGDSESELISDATITALLNINSGNINKTILQCLTAIVADLAKYTEEEVGDTKVFWDQQYEHYKQLLDRVTKDPAYMVSPVLHWFGGTSKNEVNRVNGNSDSRGQGIRQGEFTEDCYSGLNTSSPFFLQ